MTTCADAGAPSTEPPNVGAGTEWRVSSYLGRPAAAAPEAAARLGEEGPAGLASPALHPCLSPRRRGSGLAFPWQSSDGSPATARSPHLLFYRPGPAAEIGRAAARPLAAALTRVSRPRPGPRDVIGWLEGEGGLFSMSRSDWPVLSLAPPCLDDRSPPALVRPPTRQPRFLQD